MQFSVLKCLSSKFYIFSNHQVLGEGSLSKGGELGSRNNFYFGSRSSYCIKVGEHRGGSGGFQAVSETAVLFQFSFQKAVSCVHLPLSKSPRSGPNWSMRMKEKM
jgi:hypothetical protein